MPKFIIKWDIGYGQSVEIVECESVEQAKMCAYYAARKEFENRVNYTASPFSKEEWEANRLAGQSADE